MCEGGGGIINCSGNSRLLYENKSVKQRVCNVKYSHALPHIRELTGVNSIAFLIFKPLIWFDISLCLVNVLLHLMLYEYLYKLISINLFLYSEMIVRNLEGYPGNKVERHNLNNCNTLMILF